MSIELNDSLAMSESDYHRLSHLVEVSRSTATYELDEELSKAEILPDTALPETFVALYDTVIFKDLDSGRRRMVSIVMPWESNVSKSKISILSPIGIALIGEPLGTRVVWPLLNGASANLEIIDIIRHVSCK